MPFRFRFQSDFRSFLSIKKTPVLDCVYTESPESVTVNLRTTSDDIVRPNNTVATVGSRVVVRCTANADSESRWDYYQFGANAMSSVYNGHKVHDSFSRRFNLDLDSCKVRVCDLVIRRVKLDDAGFFVCFQPSIKTRIAAALVVLGTPK